MLSLLTSAKLLCVVNSVTAIALPLQEIGSQKLLGEWVAIWKIQEAHWFDGETARYQPSQDIIYTLMFEPSGRATLNGKSFRYSVRQPNKVALYALVEKKQHLAYILIVTGNTLYFYCPPKLVAQESIALVYEMKFIKKR